MLLVAIVSGRRRIDVAGIIGAIAIVGCGISLFWLEVDSKSAFYMALPRAWELALGATLVFLPPLGRIASEVAMALGAALIVAGFVVARPWAFPGAAALYPCIGAALMIWPRRQPIRTATALGWLAPVGLISYSLYLWHLPVWVFYRFYINGGVPDLRETLAIAVASVLIAFLSYRYIEQPFRTRRFEPVQVVKAGLLACGLLFCCSTYIESADGLPDRISRDHAGMRSGEVMWNWPCPPVTRVADDLPPLCTFGAPWAEGVEKAILWGDSNAEHLPRYLNCSQRTRTSRSCCTTAAMPPSMRMS